MTLDDRHLGVRPDREGVDAELVGDLGEPGEAEAVAVALGDRDDRRVGVAHLLEVTTPAGLVDVEGQHRPQPRRAM